MLARDCASDFQNTPKTTCEPVLPLTTIGTGTGMEEMVSPKLDDSGRRRRGEGKARSP